MTWVMRPKLSHKRQTKKNRETQFPINPIIRDKIEKISTKNDPKQITIKKMRNKFYIKLK
jgi:hypothetical protein